MTDRDTREDKIRAAGACARYYAKTRQTATLNRDRLLTYTFLEVLQAYGGHRTIASYSRATLAYLCGAPHGAARHRVAPHGAALRQLEEERSWAFLRPSCGRGFILEAFGASIASLCRQVPPEAYGSPHGAALRNVAFSGTVTAYLAVTRSGELPWVFGSSRRCSSSSRDTFQPVKKGECAQFHLPSRFRPS